MTILLEIYKSPAFRMPANFAMECLDPRDYDGKISIFSRDPYSQLSGHPSRLQSRTDD